MSATAAGDGPKVDADSESGGRRLPGRPVTRQCSEREREKVASKEVGFGRMRFPAVPVCLCCLPASLSGPPVGYRKSGGNGWAPQSLLLLLLLGYRRLRFLGIQQKKRGTSAFDAAAADAVRQLSYSELVSDAETETKRRLNRPD